MEVDSDHAEPQETEDNSVDQEDELFNTAVPTKSKSIASSNEDIAPRKPIVPVSANKKNVPKTNPKAPLAWKCQHCPASFKFHSFQKRHELLHFGKRPFACTFCTFSTSTMFSINEHLALHESSGNVADSNMTSRASSPSPSIASSISSTSTSRSRSTATSKPRKKRSTPRSILDEETEKLRIGNPNFIYAHVFKPNLANEIQTWKCFSCPTAYLNRANLTKHLLRHGANDGFYRCKVCDYCQTKANKQTFMKHIDRHRAQGNIPEHLLTIDDIESTKGGYDLGDATEVALIGNENDFEIEVEDVEGNVMNDDDEEFAEEAPSPLPPQLSPHMPSDTGNESLLPPSPTEEKVSSAISALQNHKISKTQRATTIIANASPAPSKSFDIYDVGSPPVEVKKAARSVSYLLTSMKVNNFMCFEDISFNLNSDAVTFSGGEGKSTSIIAILLCLGYDLLTGNTPSVICGWEISDLIRRGQNVASIEITLCLKGIPSLSKEFGNELKICRTLRRGVPLSSSAFQLTYEQDGSVTSNSVNVKRLRGILTELSISPLYSRLLLLDKQNFKLFMNDKESWYDCFMDAVAFKGKRLKTNLEKLTPLFQRLEGDLRWRKTQLTFLEEELMTDYPFEEDSAFLQWRNEDVKRRRQVEVDIEELSAKYTNLEKLTLSYTEQLSSVPSLLLKEMRTIYLEFLASQNCIGDILLDEKERNLRIWVKEKGTLDEEIPINTKEADEVWGKTPPTRKQLGTFGLYLGFWKINDNCPFFAVDAYSSAELEFKFPAKGLPILIRLVRSKFGQQFLMSYPES